MRRILIVLFIPAALLGLAGCAWFAQHGEEVGEGVKAVASILPPPLNWIVAAGGSVLGAAGSYAANRSRVESAKKLAASGVDPSVAQAGANPFLRLLSERQFLWPTLGTALAGAREAGALPLSGRDLVAALIPLGVSALAEFYHNGKADQAIAALPIAKAEVKQP